jgi:HAD superfamily hydrolase (TIGR01509 family)
MASTARGERVLSSRFVFEELTFSRGLALIFDMDGVVIQSTGLHMKAWITYLERNGVRDTSVIFRMLGKRNDQIVHEIFGTGLSEAEVVEHGAAKERLYRELMTPVLEQSYVAGVREFLRAAHARGIPLALASNAEPLNVDFVLDHAGLRSLFSAIVDGSQVTHAKPHPEVFLTAAGRIGVEPRNCVIFEDSPGGIQAALSAGGRVVGLLTTEKAYPQAELTMPDFTDPKLLPWLAEQKPV